MMVTIALSRIHLESFTEPRHQGKIAATGGQQARHKASQRELLLMAGNSPPASPVYRPSPPRAPARRPSPPPVGQARRPAAADPPHRSRLQNHPQASPPIHEVANRAGCITPTIFIIIFIIIIRDGTGSVQHLLPDCPRLAGSMARVRPPPRAPPGPTRPTGHHHPAAAGRYPCPCAGGSGGSSNAPRTGPVGAQPPTATSTSTEL